ncbi:hypothetical protein Q3G72_034704 [Acer saccharum]|nr:hypothetical protein Q3G72_034704 [Acer saccharum]
MLTIAQYSRRLPTLGFIAQPIFCSTTRSGLHIWVGVRRRMSLSMSLVLIPTAVKVCLDAHTKFSAFKTRRDINDNSKREDLQRAISFSAGVSTAACLRNGKRYFSSRRRLCCKSQLALAELAPATSAAYGILLLGGGLFAFTKSGSKGSLFGGLTGATLMASAYFLMQAPENKAIGDALGFGSTFLFSSVFGIRLAATRKLVPAGPLLGLSLCALAVFISAYMQDSL